MNELMRKRSSEFDYRNLLFIVFAFAFAIFSVAASYFGLTYLYDPEYILLFVVLIVGVGLSLLGEIIFAISINRHKAMGAYERLCRWLPLVVVGSMAVGVISTYLLATYAFSSLPEEAAGHQVYYFAALLVGALVSMVPTLICIRPDNHPVAVKPRNGFAKVINNGLPWLLVVYTALLILPWMAHPSESLFATLNDSSFALIYRYGVAALFLVYMILICIANKKLPPWSVSIVFGLVLIYILCLSFIAPRDITIIANNKQEISYEVTLKENFFFYARFCFNLLFAYSLLFIVPLAGTPKHFRNLLFYFFVLFCFVCIGYAIVAEKDKFLLAISDSVDQKYTQTMSSFFESKNGFGNCLFGGFAACLLLFADTKKPWLKGLYVTIALFFMIWTYLVKCDTALLTCAAVGLFWVYYQLIHLFKTQKTLSILSVSVLSLLFVGAFVCVLVPEIYSKVSFLEKIHTSFQSSFITGRVQIWQYYFEELGARDIFFGQGALGRYTIQMRWSDIIQSFPLHNGFVELFNQGGIILLSFYLVVLFLMGRHLSQLRKSNAPVFGVAMAVLIGFAFTSMAEALMLSLDVSLMSLLPSFLVCLAPSFYQKESAYQPDVSI